MIKKVNEEVREVYLRHAVGFLIASLIQAGIVFITEKSGISSLNAPFTFTQLLAHIIVGQIAGFILLYIMNRVEAVARLNAWITGAIYGTLAWWLLLTVNSMLGKVNAPWSQGITTVVSSLAAFMAYGIISASVINRYERKYAHRYT